MFFLMKMLSFILSLMLCSCSLTKEGYSVNVKTQGIEIQADAVDRSSFSFSTAKPLIVSQTETVETTIKVSPKKGEVNYDNILSFFCSIATIILNNLF
jgi:hypothetical protein